ncbi:MAG: amidase family protein, partial [Gammaproteobacteria bacterium]|nr:amidase family protein [Gammaproteobacteria bacterium]
MARGDYRGWMHGMPHAVKDLLPVAGLRYTDGSPMYADRIAENDDPLVARIRGEGAIFIGKTNTPEFGLGSQSYNPVFGATGSAWNPQLTSGGSSGGAASGLGTHMLPVADGSDMMGSLRNPGAFNNVIGFRPSVSVMSNNPTGPRALSTNGPMGRNTADTIRLLQTIAVQPVAS